MTDIVERLRIENDCLLGTGHDFSDVLLDAANEIERLRWLLRDLLDHEPLNDLSRLRVREVLGDE
jgi:hypothetical protein